MLKGFSQHHFNFDVDQLDPFNRFVFLFRVFILVLCVVSILWIPLVQSSAGGQLFVYIQSIQGYLGTPLGAVFLMAIFWKRMNEKVGRVCTNLGICLGNTEFKLNTELDHALFFIHTYNKILSSFSCLTHSCNKYAAGMFHDNVSFSKKEEKCQSLYVASFIWPLQAAFWGVLIGHVFGIVRMILEFVFPAPACGHTDTRPAIIARLHYSYFSQITLLIVFISIVVITLLTKPQSESEVRSLDCYNRVLYVLIDFWV